MQISSSDPSSRSYRFPRALFLVVLTSLLLACDGPRQDESPPSGAPSTRLELATEHLRLPGEGPPSIHLETVAFRGELRTRAPIVITDATTLEFVPLLQASEGEPSPPLRIYLSVEGQQKEELIASLTPQARDLRAEPWRERLGLASELERIDLSEYQGRRVRLRWSLDEPTPTRTVVLGRPRLRAPATTRPTRPDVLLVCIDTLRDDFELVADPKGETPALERFLAEAVRYRRAFSSASWTMPSIASTLTGLDPRFHGSGHTAGKVEVDAFDESAIPAGHFAFRDRDHFRMVSTYPDALLSLPEILRDEGFTTILVAANPLYFLSGLAFDGFDLAIDTGVAPGSTVNEAVFEILRFAPPEENLFLLAHYMDVHHWHRWHFDREHSGVAFENAPDLVRESYAEAVAEGTRHVDALLRRWETERDWDRTLIVLFSDHGEHLHDAPRPDLVGHGNSMDDLLLHVPLWVKYPRAWGLEGGEVDVPIGLTDLVPTIVAGLGASPIEASFSGRSLIASSDGEVSVPRSFFADYQLYGEPLASVRRGPYKLVIDTDTGELTLFDTRGPTRIPLETVEGKARERELLRELNAYRKAAAEKRKTLALSRSLDQQATEEQLRALGYLD